VAPTLLGEQGDVVNQRDAVMKRETRTALQERREE